MAKRNTTLVSEEDILKRREAIITQLTEVTNDEQLSNQMYDSYNLNRYIQKNLGEFDNWHKKDNRYWFRVIVKQWIKNHPEFSVADESVLLDS